MASQNVLTVDFGRPLSSDPERSYTLPSSWYTDPAIFEREKERIFHRSWIYACHESQVANPGDYATVQVVDQGVAVVRGRDGTLRAFYNVCQHRAHELLQGTGNVKAVITCPYHAWAYDLQGKLRTARNCESVKGFDKADFTLKGVRVEIFCNLVFVNLDPDAVPLAEQAPNLERDIREVVPQWDELRLRDSYDFGGRPIDAGWKVVVDNYVECYHCAPAHPAFADMIDMPSYEHTIDGITARQLGPRIKADNTAYRLGEGDTMMRSVFWYLWPTTTINVLPGKGDVFITNVVPHGPATTAFVNNRFSVSDAPEIAERRNYAENILGVEDLLLCESVQRGLRSKGYDQGRLIVDEARTGEGEHVVHFFHKMVLDALTG